MNRTLVIGVDGGGTKTVALLAEVNSVGQISIIGRGVAESSNINAVGWDVATSNLGISIEQAWHDAHTDPIAVPIAVLALSGAGQESAKQKFSSWAAETGIAVETKVIHDAEAVVRAGTEHGWGVALIAGTGSVAFAFDRSQQATVAGGWGYWYGDEGSAFWLGQAALRAVSQASDGRGPGTSLSRALLDRLVIEEPRQMLSALSADSNVRHNIAGLAQTVVQQAEAGDVVAMEIVRTGANHLASLVQSAARAFTQEPSFPLAMAGGVLSGSTLVRSTVEHEMKERQLKVSKIELVEEPAHGALKLAAEIYGNQ